MDVVTNEECPVCKGDVQNPTEPSLCCRKVFCQSCLTQSVRRRLHCPYCRSAVFNPYAIRTTRLGQNRFPLPGLADADASFSARGRVGNNIQDLLNQLRDAQAQSLQPPQQNADPASQAAPVPTGQVTRTIASTLQRRLPRPRPQLQPQTFLNRVPTAAPPPAPAVNPIITAQATPAPPPAPPTPAAAANPFNVAQAPPVAPRPAPRPVPRPAPRPALRPALPSAPPIPRLNSSPLILPDSASDLIDQLFLPHLINLIDNSEAQPSGPTLRTYKCPYCQQDGLDDLELRDHCNANHINDTRQVVCPVCVSLPHGDPLYHSRDFIGHLNLRHCYYIDDITNVHQSDEVNLQAGILMSLSNNN